MRIFHIKTAAKTAKTTYKKDFVGEILYVKIKFSQKGIGFVELFHFFQFFWRENVVFVIIETHSLAEKEHHKVIYAQHDCHKWHKHGKTINSKNQRQAPEQNEIQHCRAESCPKMPSHRLEALAPSRKNVAVEND